MPHITFIHGIANKPPKDELLRNWEDSLAAGGLDLAAEGREVALVSSGDPGIYAMATLAYELIDREERPEWARIDVITAPGISALQAAAARAGPASSAPVLLRRSAPL